MAWLSQVLLSLSCFLLLCEATTLYSGSGFPGSKDQPTILLGGLFPIHRNEDNFCGAILDLGFQRLEAMVFATRRINRSPDLLPGLTLGFEIRDTCVQANLALEESLSYVRDRGVENSTLLGISGVVGAASSGISIVVANLLRLFQVPQISYASTAKILSDKTRFDYFFRTVPPDSLQARTMADIIRKFKWTYIHAIYSDDAYGSEGIAAFFEELNQLNRTEICTASESKLPLGLTIGDDQFKEAILELDREWIGNSSVVVLFGQLATAQGILAAVKRRDEENPGFASRFTWIGSDAWGDQLDPEFHSVARGMLSVSPKASTSAEFDDYFTSLNPLTYTENPWFREYWEDFFNCSFTDPLRSPCDPAKQAISPETNYRQNSKVTFTIDAVYAFAHAINNLISTNCPDPDVHLCNAVIHDRSGGVAIRGELLLEFLKNVSFPGASADKIEFDSSGDEQGDFVIKNLKRNSGNGGGGGGQGFFYETVGTWSPLTFLDLYGDIEWNGEQEEVPLSICSLPCEGGEFPEPISGEADCCWICQPCPTGQVSTGLDCYSCSEGTKPNAGRTKCEEIVPNFLQWSSPWAIVIIIVTLVGFAATMGVVVLLIICLKHPLVKASSRELSFMMLTGLALCYIMPFFFLAKPSVGICAIRRLGVGIAFATCYGALFIKTNRVHRIFKRAQNSLQKPPLISPQSQVFFTLLLVAVQCVIAVVWLTIDPPRVIARFTDTDGELRCGDSPIVGFFIHAAYNFLLLCLSTFYGVRSRKIPQSFNESKLINFTVFSSVLLWIGLVPTYFATALLASVYQTISLVIAVILSATVMLCILFMSKVYFLISNKRKELRELNDTQGVGNNKLTSGINNARRLSVDLLSVRSPRNQPSLWATNSPSMTVGSLGHTHTLNTTGLMVPKTCGGGGKLKSAGSTIGSHASSAEKLCSVSKIDLTDAFTQTSIDEKINEVAMGVTISTEPVSAVFLPTNDDLELCEALRAEMEAADLEEAKEKERAASVDKDLDRASGNSDLDATTSHAGSHGHLDVAEDSCANEAPNVADAETDATDPDGDLGRVGEPDVPPEPDTDDTCGSAVGSSAADQQEPKVFNAVNVCAIVVTDESGVASPLEACQ